MATGPAFANGLERMATRWGDRSSGSVVATNGIRRIEPFADLTAILEATGAGHPERRVGDLMPWNVQPPS